MSIVHPIPPVFDERSEILILGSFPSVKSRETGFYYGHPQNRFWKTLAAVYGEKVPETTEEKRSFLLSCRLALWDVIGECEIKGSSDASIRSVKPNDLTLVTGNSPVKKVVLNGNKAFSLYEKYHKDLDLPYLKAPSTSPANAAYSLSRLAEEWGKLLKNQ